MHGAATTAALPSADAVLLVSDAAQEYTAPELEFLAQATAVCPNVACVVTKTDLYPEWRRIVELNRGHLATAGITDGDLRACRRRCAGTPSCTATPTLNAESGFPELVGYLRKRVLGQADRLARRGVVHDVLAVTEQIAGNLLAERTAQQDPAAAAALVRELTEAQQRATALKERSARWQQTLNDGVADLNADIDYDLRDRMKEISRLAEDELMGGGDPAKVWDQFAALGAAGGGDRGVRELHLGDAAGARAGPARRRPLLRRPRPAAARAAQRPVGRDPVGAPDGRARPRTRRVGRRRR